MASLLLQQWQRGAHESSLVDENRFSRKITTCTKVRHLARAILCLETSPRGSLVSKVSKKVCFWDMISQFDPSISGPFVSLRRFLVSGNEAYVKEKLSHIIYQTHLLFYFVKHYHSLHCT